MNRPTGLRASASKTNFPAMDHHTPIQHLGLAMIRKAFSPETINTIEKGEPLSMLVMASDDDHANVIHRGLQTIMHETTSVHLATAANQSLSNGGILDCLEGAEPVIVIASRLDHVSAAVQSHLETIVKVPPYDTSIVDATLSSLFPGAKVELPSPFPLHSSPKQTAMCILPELGAVRCVEALVRLGRTAHQRTQVAAALLPELEDCVEFGPAQAWGLRVKSDIAAWQEGEMSPEEMDNCILLVGPPGMGKTRFAQVLAQSLSAPLIQCTVGQLQSGDGHLSHVLDGLRAAFRDAIEKAPAVLLLDEIDSFCRRDLLDHNSSFTNAVINELLVLLDDISTRAPGLVVIGATNLPRLLDPALLRPGRLHRRIDMALPDASGVEHIVRTHLKGDLRDASLTQVVRFAVGRTPAELMELVRSARQVARRENRSLELQDLIAVTLGDSEEDEDSKFRIAVHETGHALLSLILPMAPSMTSISLVGSGSKKGHVSLRHPEGPSTRSTMEAHAMVMLAGRAAETVVFGNDPSDGSAMDFEVATDIVAEMHCHYGMRGSLIHVRDARSRLEQDERFAAIVDQELQRHLAAAMDILSSFRSEILVVAQALVEKRVMTASEVAAIFGASRSMRKTTADDFPH